MVASPQSLTEQVKVGSGSHPFDPGGSFKQTCAGKGQWGAGAKPNERRTRYRHLQEPCIQYVTRVCQRCATTFLLEHSS